MKISKIILAISIAAILAGCGATPLEQQSTNVQAINKANVPTTPPTNYNGPDSNTAVTPSTER